MRTDPGLDAAIAGATHDDTDGLCRPGGASTPSILGGFDRDSSFNTTNTEPPDHPPIDENVDAGRADGFTRAGIEPPPAESCVPRVACAAPTAGACRPSRSLGFDVGPTRAAIAARAAWPGVVAATTPDAHAIVDTMEAATRLAEAIRACSSVVVTTGPERVAVRLQGMPFTHVVDAAVAQVVLDALIGSKVVGHDLVPALARVHELVTDVFDTRIVAALVHHAESADDAELGLAACVTRHHGGVVSDTPESDVELVRATTAIERLRTALEKDVTRLGLEEAVALEHFGLPGLVDAHRHGLLIDREGWAATLEGARARRAELLASLTAALKTGDLHDAAKVRWALRGLGLEVTGTKAYDLFPWRAHPTVRDLEEHRRVNAFVNDLGPSVLAHLDAGDRVHATYDPVGAATGRISTRAPNVMGLPRAMRGHVIAPPGHVLVDADYSAIELRVIADRTGDARFHDAFKRGVDVHRLTASMVTGKAYEKISKEERRRAKPVNFGWVYGMSIGGFMRNAVEDYGIVFTADEAKTMRSRYFSAYAGVQRWHDDLRTTPPTVVKSASGRTRRMPEAGQTNLMLPFRTAANSPVQGTAADGLKRALGLLARRLPEFGAHIVCSVHDQVLVEVRDDLAEQVKGLVVATMKEAMAVFVKSVPIEVDASIKKSWGG